jgi:two-component system invasion response regulator UvrY
MNVLIAEDHNLTAKLLERMLSDAGNISVVGVVSNGLGVLRAISEMHIDVILMDVTMPYLDGIETLEKLLEIAPKVKTVMLSAHTEGWIVEKSLQMGARGYLTKKVDVNQVLEAINTVYNGDHYLDDISLKAMITQDGGSGSGSGKHYHYC